MLDTGLLLGVQIILDGAILCREMGAGERKGSGAG